MLTSPLARVLALEAASGVRAAEKQEEEAWSIAAAAADAGSSLSGPASLFSVDLHHSRRLPSVAFAIASSSTSLRSKSKRSSGLQQQQAAAQPQQSRASPSSPRLLPSSLAPSSSPSSLLPGPLSPRSLPAAAVSRPVLVSRPASSGVHRRYVLYVCSVCRKETGDKSKHSKHERACRRRLWRQMLEAQREEELRRRQLSKTKAKRARELQADTERRQQREDSKRKREESRQQGDSRAAPEAALRPQQQQRRQQAAARWSSPSAAPPALSPSELRRAVSAELAGLYSTSDCRLPGCLLSRSSLLSRIELQLTFAQPQLWRRFSASELRSLCALLPAVDRPLPEAEDDAAAAEAALLHAVSLPVFSASVVAYQQLLRSGSLDPALKGVRMLSAARRRRQLRDGSRQTPNAAHPKAAAACDSYWADGLSDALPVLPSSQQQQLTFSFLSPAALPSPSSHPRSQARVRVGSEEETDSEANSGSGSADGSGQQQLAVSEERQAGQEEEPQPQPAPLHARYRRSSLPVQPSLLPLPSTPLPVLPPPPSSFPHIQRFMLRSPRFRRAKHLRLVLRADRRSTQRAGVQRAPPSAASAVTEREQAASAPAASPFSHLPAAAARDCQSLLRLCWSEEQKAEAGRRIAAAASGGERREQRRQLAAAYTAERRLLELMEAQGSSSDSGWENGQRVAAAEEEKEEPARAAVSPVDCGLPEDEEKHQAAHSAATQLLRATPPGCRSFGDFVLFCCRGAAAAAAAVSVSGSPE